MLWKYLLSRILKAYYIFLVSKEATFAILAELFPYGYVIDQWINTAFVWGQTTTCYFNDSRVFHFSLSSLN